ncbi:MAG: OmpW family outer membrane protein [Pseudomonadota bacterium]
MKNKLLVLALAAALPASALADDWMMRVRAIQIAPDVSSSLAGIDVSDEWVPEIDFTYFFTPNIGAELVLGTARHEVTLNGASLGKLNHLPPTLTLQYHFNPTGTVRPYVGAGINYTRFYNVDLTGLKVDNNSFGGALQAGVDIAVTKNGYLNLDVKKIWIDTTVKTTAGANVSSLDIDPVVWGIGYGFRF